MKDNSVISISVIKRLPRYYRFLGELMKSGTLRISSGELSIRMGLTASQVRQDFNCFGGFGQQGYGYNVQQLREEIGAILGLNDRLELIMVGAGNLGRAIALHMDFDSVGFRLAAIFDNDKALTQLTIRGLKVMDSALLAGYCKENRPAAAVLCIPPDKAPEVVDDLISYGIRGFWNFSHYDIHTKYPDVCVENVHLSDSLMTLSYQMKHN